MNPADPQHYQPEQAIEHARRAVELNPNSWQLQLNLAEVLAHCRHEQEAADLFEAFARRARENSPERKLYLERASYLRRQ
ncbi:MAG: hypothetical protein IID41_13145 [Planctomycetes bacterium]|nr:hypothetical protein [Planctomycetota bacterium]